MLTVLVLIALCVIVARAADVQTVGDRLLRTYLSYDTLPTTIAEAKAAGYETTGTCHPALGVGYSLNDAAATEDTPLRVWFTASGHVAGVGVRIFGSVKPKLYASGFFKKVKGKNDQYDIDISFRAKSEMCSSTVAAPHEILGDRLIINADTIAREIPVTSDEAEKKNWTKGSCFYSMGTHYFYDLETAPHMSWNSSNVLPIVAMYRNQGVNPDHRINAIFFASTAVQQGFLSGHEWDRVPLLNPLMCKNMCDSSCTFAGTSAWSTMHIFFRDIEQATCEGGCNISCCPGGRL